MQLYLLFIHSQLLLTFFVHFHLIFRNCTNWTGTNLRPQDTSSTTSTSRLSAARRAGRSSAMCASYHFSNLKSEFLTLFSNVYIRRTETLLNLKCTRPSTKSPTRRPRATTWPEPWWTSPRLCALGSRRRTRDWCEQTSSSCNTKKLQT